MRDITAEELKSLVIYLNKECSDSEISISGIVDTINEWVEDNDLIGINPVQVYPMLCQTEEVERGLWDLDYVRDIESMDFKTVYYIYDITVEEGAVTVYALNRVEEDY